MTVCGQQQWDECCTTCSQAIPVVLLRLVLTVAWWKTQEFFSLLVLELRPRLARWVWIVLVCWPKLTIGNLV